MTAIAKSSNALISGIMHTMMCYMLRTTLSRGNPARSLTLGSCFMVVLACVRSISAEITAFDYTSVFGRLARHEDDGTKKHYMVVASAPSFQMEDGSRTNP